MSVYEQLLAKVLSVYYNVKYGGYLLGNVLGYGPDILSVKERKVKPPVLTEGITDHTVKINVSIWVAWIPLDPFYTDGSYFRVLTFITCPAAMNPNH